MQQTPVSIRYRQDLQNGVRMPDAAQAEAIKALSRVQKQLIHAHSEQPGFFARLFGREPKAVQGLYLWGGVGRGKTYVMDLFFETMPGTRKQRLHFHRFMHWLHGELKKRKGEANPLQRIGEELCQRIDVLCFDEFFVTDIGDAMLLAGLLDTFFRHRLVLVATSNIPPKDLYRNGLARDNFLPAIALIEQHCQIMEMDSGTDYRLRDLQTHGVYLTPNTPESETILAQRFQMMDGLVHSSDTLTINDRAIHTRGWKDGVAWFDFTALCESARAQADYIEIAREFHTVLISHVPQLSAKNDDAARRFISLVDEFYERKVKLSMVVAVPLEDIYVGEMLAFPFERTRSRLQEMQTEAYLTSAHIP